jgi:hypothetical protein
MYGGVKYRQLEYNFIIYLRRFNMYSEKVHYDGQFIWVTK